MTSEKVSKQTYSAILQLDSGNNIFSIYLQILIPTLWQSEKHWVLYVMDLREKQLWCYNSLEVDSGLRLDISHLVRFHLYEYRVVYWGHEFTFGRIILRSVS